MPLLQSAELKRSLVIPEIEDVTLRRIGYQTDNGAMYCFCRQANCSATLIDVVNSLKSSFDIPMGYFLYNEPGHQRGEVKPHPGV